MPAPENHSIIIHRCNQGIARHGVIGNSEFQDVSFYLRRFDDRIDFKRGALVVGFPEYCSRSRFAYRFTAVSFHKVNRVSSCLWMNNITICRTVVREVYQTGFVWSNETNSLAIYCQVVTGCYERLDIIFGEFCQSVELCRNISCTFSG